MGGSVNEWADMIFAWSSDTHGALTVAADKALDQARLLWRLFQESADAQVAAGFLVIGTGVATLFVRGLARSLAAVPDPAGLPADRPTAAGRTGRDGGPSEAAAVAPIQFDPDAAARDFIEALKRQRDKLGDARTATRAAVRAAIERAVTMEEQNRQLSRLIADLHADRRHWPEAAAGIDDAIAAFRGGHIDRIEVLLRSCLERLAGDGGAIAPALAARHLAALASLHDTGRAIALYRQATVLAPDDPDAWCQLGGLLLKIGDFEAADHACQRVMTIGDPIRDRSVLAASVANLGLIQKTLGRLDKAAEHFRISLAFYGAMGSTEGMVRQYGNLAQVAMARGDLDQAEAHYRKALAAEEQLGRNEGIAAAYGSLAQVFQARGDRVAATEYWTLARDLYTVIGMPHIARLVEEVMANAAGRAPADRLRPEPVTAA